MQSLSKIHTVFLTLFRAHQALALGGQVNVYDCPRSARSQLIHQLRKSLPLEVRCMIDTATRLQLRGAREHTCWPISTNRGNSFLAGSVPSVTRLLRKGGIFKQTAPGGAHFMLFVANAGATPLRTSRQSAEAVSCVTRLVRCDALVSCARLAGVSQLIARWVR